MKKLPGLLAFLIFALAACLPVGARGQTPPPVPTWAQSYGVGAYDRSGNPVMDDSGDSGMTGADLPRAIAPMPDGGVVVAGQLGLLLYGYDDAYQGSAIVRYNATGQIVWQQLLRLNSDVPGPNGIVADSHIARMRTDAAGNIFVCGGLTSPGPNKETPFVAKFSADGALVWQNGVDTLRFAFPRSDGGTDIVTDSAYPFSSMDLTADGGVVVGGAVFVALAVNNPNAHTTPFLVKFNADGTLGFHREYENPIQYSGVISLCTRPGGLGYALLLQPNPYNPANNGAAVTVVLTDATGTPVGQRTFFSDGYGGTPQFITASSDGGFLFLSALISGNGDGSQVHKLNASLSPVWQTQIHNSSTAGTLTPTPDGGCI
ncbi:MAG: hypothetical protein ABI992_07530, partial [Chthoniobacterales bacterium]